MPSRKFAAAQYKAIPGDIRANLQRHMLFVQAAAEESVRFLVFPELSLIGYELPLLQARAIVPEDESLSKLRELCVSADMTVVVGAPLARPAGERPGIGAICLHADGTTTTYQKRFLHSGEESFAHQGDAAGHIVSVDSERVALAICADTVHDDHPRWAADAGASIYAAGVLWSEAGYVADAALMQRYASTYGFAALVANYAAPTGGYISAGMSAFWKPDGVLAAVAPPHRSALLVAESRNGDWACNCHELDV